MTLHRVVEISQTEGGKTFITKGDANNAPDPDPIFSNQIRGKLILAIPKLGWIPIYFKMAIASVWAFLSTNITLAYALLTSIVFTTLIYAIHTYKNRSHRHWLRRRW